MAHPSWYMKLPFSIPDEEMGSQFPVLTECSLLIAQGRSEQWESWRKSEKIRWQDFRSSGQEFRRNECGRRKHKSPVKLELNRSWSSTEVPFQLKWFRFVLGSKPHPCVRLEGSETFKHLQLCDWGSQSRVWYLSRHICYLHGSLRHIR